MNTEGAASRDSEGNKETLVESGRKEDPCYTVGENFHEIGP